MAEQNPSDSSLKTPVISCPSLPAFSDPQERIIPNAPEGLDDSNNMSSQAKKEKRRPPGTVEYTVGPQESLNSIALKFNITPNKLVQLNRLFSRSVYPGQKLFVPDVGQSEADSQSVGSSDPTSIKDLAEKDGDFSGRSVRPLRRERSSLSEDENPAIVKFIKMSCKYFTDGMGVVGGVMIVTPNNIMFDPHKSDPLVIEHGCEEYGLICPMEEVVSVALYNDISRPTQLSLSETAAASGKCSSQEPSPAEEWLSEEEKRKRSNKAEVKSWLLERMQAPIQNMLLSTEEKSKTPPMFLCFKVGKPMRKSFIIGRTSSPAHTRGKQPEYWFAVPQERVDHLYAFFVQWSPDVYGKEAREQGFVVVEKDELNMIDNFFSDPKSSRSWEIITINEAKRRQSFGSYDGEEPFGDLLPMLSDPSALLQDTHIEKLACRLPARVQGYPWQLAYSTVEHGTSLKTLYRSLLEVDSPVLLVIKDMDNQLFGGYSTHPFRVSEHCYGTGETFLFSFCPEIKVYRWTGENSYFVKGNTDSLQMGGGGGQIGLWLDADLYHGTTSSCATFHNQPLSTQKDFIIHSVEVWAFE
uniref:Nuclear receptor coactivator 7 n=1 Tax=Oncorhynchus kisutch TaxID=8019 RepID=A0A8C7CHM9_ONCKI